MADALDWFLQGLYGSGMDVLILEVVNFCFAFYLIWMLFSTALKWRGSTARTFRLLAYAFVAFAAHEAISIFGGVYPESIRWELLYVFSETVFLATAIYALLSVKDSLAACNYLLKK